MSDAIKRFLRRCMLFAVLIGPATVSAQSQAPHPRDVFGFTPGDDYQLANYTQMLEYYRQLSAASNRVELREIGTSVLGRPLLLLFISSEGNIARLDEWRSASEKLARARIAPDEARKLATSARAIVWIDGGLHATEVAHAQMTTLLAHRVATEESEEMQQIREETILLLMPVMNPDGLDIVADWYKKNLKTPFETTRPPWLYHHYVGHDNNRDWFMNNMPESQAVNQVLYNEWYPQIVYNHHQTGPSWTRIFLPPFADPVNPNIHPGVTTGVNLVGSAMANRFAMRRMPGVVSRVIYSMWWNGGMRTVPYFHNMIGILTETSHATPSPRFFDPDSMPKAVANRRGGGFSTGGTEIFYPYPWKGGTSRFADPVRYMLTGSMAVLKIAADMREHWLNGIYAMGRDGISHGLESNTAAYVIPRAERQWNAGEELALMRLLHNGGIEIHTAGKEFKKDGKSWPAGTFVIRTDQPFRSFLVDLMEKQEYPERRTSPGGAPEPPYDLAGWTLPLQMGITVDHLDAVPDADLTAAVPPFQPDPGKVHGGKGVAWLLSPRTNASVRGVNTLLGEGAAISRISGPVRVNKVSFDSGSFVVANEDGMQDHVQSVADSLGLDFHAVTKSGLLRETGPQIPRPRIGLYKSWVASMDEGWTRWLLKSYSFRVDTLHDDDIRSGQLQRYTAILLPHQSASRILNGHVPGTMPDAYVGGLGTEGALALKNYVKGGGRLVALDGASDFVIDQMGLPLRNAVNGVSSRQFFIPGSLVRLVSDTSHALAAGMPAETAASFVRSRAFRKIRLSRRGEGGREDIPEAPPLPVDVVAHYAKDDILMSGWALGEKRYIGGKAAVVRVRVGDGDIVLFGFRPQFRGQSRGTYKLLFNALLGAGRPAGAQSSTTAPSGG